MINIQLVLSTGVIGENSGRFEINDEYDMTIANFKSDVQCDNVNDLLRGLSLINDDLAELRLKVEGIDHDGFLVASFKRTKVKTKHGSEIRWVVTD